MNFAGARGPDDSQRCARFCAKNDEFGTEYDRFVLKMMIFYRKMADYCLYFRYLRMPGSVNTEINKNRSVFNE